MIDFGARENHIANWGVARSVPRPKLRCGFNLHTQVRRGVDQAPFPRSDAPGKLSLCTGRTEEVALPQTATIHTPTVPLWEATARRAAQYFDLHPRAVKWRALKRRANPSDFRYERHVLVIEDLELAVAVRVDFAAKADFLNLRGFPFHRLTLPSSQLLPRHILSGSTVCMQARSPVKPFRFLRRVPVPLFALFERSTIAIFGCSGRGWRSPPSARGCKSSP